MLEDKDKLYGLLYLIETAKSKAKEIVLRNDGQEKQSLADIIDLLDDAGHKLCNLRWADKNSIDYGLGFYVKSIKQI